MKEDRERRLEMSCITIESLIAAWVDAFNSHDLDRHVALYTDDALLFGSTDELYRGRDGVRAYFGKLPADASVRNYPPPVIRHLDDGTAITAGYVDFADGERLLPYRMTWTLVRRGGEWKIAQHHGSPRRSTES